MEESKTIAGMENENRSGKDFQVQETEGDEVVMMCWENLEGFWQKSLTKKQVVKMEELMTRCEKPRRTWRSYTTNRQLTKNLDR